MSSLTTTGLFWWKWSALYAVIIGVLGFLALLVYAILGHVEFAVLGMYYVAMVTAIALPATAMLIFVWLALTRVIPVINTNRWWLVAYTLILSWPLYFSPISLYELALSTPTLLGFILPRFFVSKLSHVEVKGSAAQ